MEDGIAIGIEQDPEGILIDATCVKCKTEGMLVIDSKYAKALLANVKPVPVPLMLWEQIHIAICKFNWYDENKEKLADEICAIVGSIYEKEE